MKTEFVKRLISSPDELPLMIVFAGTNGAGKSQLTEILAHRHSDVQVIDADAIARQLQQQNPSGSNLAAGRETIKRVQAAIEQGKNFSIETTLAGGNVLRQMEAAKAQGFHIRLYYVGLASVDHHIDRVAQRVSLGGHDIPESDIRRRYETSLANLPKAIRLADHSYVFDNTQVYSIQMEVNRGLICYEAPNLPAWVQKTVKAWEKEQNSYLKDLKNEQGILNHYLRENKVTLRDIQDKLRLVKNLQDLQHIHTKLSKDIDGLQSRGLIARIAKPRKKEIIALTNRVKHIESTLRDAQVITPSPSEVPLLQHNLKGFLPLIDAIQSALQRVERDILAIQNQQHVRHLQRQFSQVQHVEMSQSQELGL